MMIELIENKEPKIKQNHSADLICKFCKAEDSIRAHYSELAYGSAMVINRDGELENYEADDSDDFTINEYECDECGKTKNHLEDLIFSEEELEEQDEENE
jgi:hypothetical protein